MKGYLFYDIIGIITIVIIVFYSYQKIFEINKKSYVQNVIL